ncbi:hypothetical protein GCM10022252_74940 [Streptosporangium oxazolinicum]|uniref:Uncharacterized protein n=1 Tax=Streptosporangium oxazolinicum TaxID=909287 RepID=A0ABP8BKE3_9ACTN
MLATIWRLQDHPDNRPEIHPDPSHPIPDDPEQLRVIRIHPEFGASARFREGSQGFVSVRQGPAGSGRVRQGPAGSGRRLLDLTEIGNGKRTSQNLFTVG